MPIISFSVINRQTIALPALSGDYPLVYIDEWDADVNNLGLQSSVGTKGETYKVAQAGTTDLDGNAVWNVGDYATFNGTVWDRLAGGISLTSDAITDSTAAGRAMLTAADAAAQLALLPNTILQKNATAQLAIGYTQAPNALGTLSSFTPNIALGNVQYGTNNGAFTITAPTADGGCEITITNGANAGTISFSGFTGSIMGDAYNTTNANVFTLVIRRINGVSRGWWLAWQ